MTDVESSFQSGKYTVIEHRHEGCSRSRGYNERVSLCSVLQKLYKKRKAAALPILLFFLGRTQGFPNLPATLQYHNTIRIAIPFTDFHQNTLILERILPLRGHDPFLLSFLLFLLPHPLPFSFQHLCQFPLQHATQITPLCVAVEERDHTLTLFRRFKRFMV